MSELNLKKHIKEQNKIVSEWLVYYHERKKSHEEERQEIYKKPEISGSSKFQGKPTETLAIKLAEHDNNNTAKWLRTTEDVSKILSPKKVMLLNFRQQCKFYISPMGGRPGWIAPVQYKLADSTGWCPSEQKLREMWQDIIHLTIRVAFLHGCKF